MKARLYAADGRGRALIGGREVEVRQLCQYGNGACSAEAQRVLLTDSAIEQPTGSVVFACEDCADRMAFGLLMFADSVVSLPIGEYEALRKAVDR